VHVGMEKVALKEIAGSRRTIPPIRVTKIFVAFPRLAPERQIPDALFIERNKFDRIPEVCAQCRTAQISIILVGAIQSIGR